jgi:hypothetical protein
MCTALELTDPTAVLISGADFFGLRTSLMDRFCSFAIDIAALFVLIERFVTLASPSRSNLSGATTLCCYAAKTSHYDLS